MRKFQLVVVPADDEDLSETDPTGLTREAYDRLSDAIADAGFSIESGPTVVAPDPA